MALDVHAHIMSTVSGAHMHTYLIPLVLTYLASLGTLT